MNQTDLSFLIYEIRSKRFTCNNHRPEDCAWCSHNNALETAIYIIKEMSNYSEKDSATSDCDCPTCIRLRDFKGIDS